MSGGNIEQQVAERIEADLADHKLSVLRDSGLYKHLWFGKPGTGNLGFNIHTAPGTLTVWGDMGTYVFAREADMISWFLGSAYRGQPNLSYWAEKCQAPEGRRGLQEYSETFLRQRIEESLQDDIHCEGLDAAEAAEYRAAAWEHLSIYDLSDPRTYGDLGRFQWRDLRPFEDSWEWGPYEYTYHYVWTAHALLRALTAYREQAAPAVVTPRPAAFEQPELQHLHRRLVEQARQRPEYSTPDALSAYAEGVEHAIESLWMKEYRDVSELARAWHDAGPVPAYHEEAKRRLAQSWPTLHGAVVKTTKGARP